MLKKAAVLTLPPLRAKTRIAPNKAPASEEGRRCMPGFACTARFDHMRADKHLAITFYVEPLSKARTKLENFSAAS